MYNRSCFLLNNVTRRRSTHDVKFMTMHQYAFVQKCSALTSTALPPPRLNVQLTLSGEKVNMSTAPYTLKIYLFLNLGFHKEQQEAIAFSTVWARTKTYSDTTALRNAWTRTGLPLMNLSKLQSPASAILLSFAVKSFTVFSGDFFFREGCGWNSRCLRAEIITYIVQHPIFVCWAKISGT